MVNSQQQTNERNDTEIDGSGKKKEASPTSRVTSGSRGRRMVLTPPVPPKKEDQAPWKPTSPLGTFNESQRGPESLSAFTKSQTRAAALLGSLPLASQSCSVVTTPCARKN